MEFWADMDVHDFIILSTAKLLELNCFVKLWGKFIAILLCLRGRKLKLW